MGDSTAKGSADSRRRGFWAYWGRVLMRSLLDTKTILGTNPLKALIGLVVVVVAAMVVKYFFQRDAWDKVEWAALAVLIGGLVFASFWLIVLVQTPWKFEDEAAIERATEHQGMLAKMDELKIAIEQKQARHQEEVAVLKKQAEDCVQQLSAQEALWQTEREKLQNSDVDRNLKRHKLRTYLDDFKRFLERLLAGGTQAETHQAISEMYKYEGHVQRCLLEDFKYDDFRRNKLSLPTQITSYKEMYDRVKLGKPAPAVPIERTQEDRGVAAECCKDRIMHLERLLNIVG